MTEINHSEAELQAIQAANMEADGEQEKATEIRQELVKKYGVPEKRRKRMRTTGVFFVERDEPDGWDLKEGEQYRVSVMGGHINGQHVELQHFEKQAILPNGRTEIIHGSFDRGIIGTIPLTPEDTTRLRADAEEILRLEEEEAHHVAAARVEQVDTHKAILAAENPPPIERERPMLDEAAQAEYDALVAKVLGPRPEKSPE